jgi:hypothetical protein
MKGSGLGMLRIQHGSESATKEYGPKTLHHRFGLGKIMRISGHYIQSKQPVFLIRDVLEQLIA